MTTVLLNAEPVLPPNTQRANQFDYLTMSLIGLWLSSHLSKQTVDEFHLYLSSKYFPCADATSLRESQEKNIHLKEEEKPYNCASSS